MQLEALAAAVFRMQETEGGHSPNLCGWWGEEGAAEAQNEPFAYMYCHGLSRGRIVLPALAWERSMMGQYTSVCCTASLFCPVSWAQLKQSLYFNGSLLPSCLQPHQLLHLSAERGRAWLVAILVVALALPVSHSGAILFSAVLPAVLGICKHCWMQGGGAGAICPGSYS